MSWKNDCWSSQKKHCCDDWWKSKEKHHCDDDWSSQEKHCNDDWWKSKEKCHCDDNWSSKRNKCRCKCFFICCHCKRKIGNIFNVNVKERICLLEPIGLFRKVDPSPTSLLLLNF